MLVLNCFSNFKSLINALLVLDVGRFLSAILGFQIRAQPCLFLQGLVGINDALSRLDIFKIQHWRVSGVIKVHLIVYNSHSR